MVVTWVTQQLTKSVVEYGLSDLDSYKTGRAENFTDGGSESRYFFIHRVVLQGLKPGAKYSK